MTGYPPVTGSVVRVTSVVESTTPVAPGPPESTCPTATEPARASRADGVQPWCAAAAPATRASRLTRPVTTTTAEPGSARSNMQGMEAELRVVDKMAAAYILQGALDRLGYGQAD